jgi:hypothetical protein
VSRRTLGEGEEVIPDDDDWLDEIALYTGISQSPYRSDNLQKTPI